MSFLAIDQSTTSTSAFLFETSGKVQNLYAAPHAQLHPRPGWVEHNPNEILTHVSAAIDAGRAAGAQAFALSNQGESCLAWDARTGTPISPIIVWQDARTTDRCTQIAKASAARVATTARLPVTPYFSASKLGWIMENIPEAAALANAGHLRLGTTDAFLRDRLTGQFETDVATASRTSLMTLETGEWDSDLCTLFGVPIDCLPKIGDCSGDLGAVDGLPLVAALVDQQAALYGHGVAQAGQTKFTFGTGAFAQTLVGSQCPALAHGVLPTVAWREAGQQTQFALDGGIHTAASAVDWARGLGLFTDYGDLSNFEGHALSRGLAFVPALAGLACPHWDNGAKGTWLGLTLATTPQDMMQALLEGIAYRAAEVCGAMEQVLPLTGALLVDGGMTQNPWFCQLLANVLERDVAVAQLPDITAFGAAQMAARYCGADLPMGATQTIYRPKTGFVPDPARFAEACAIAKAWP